MSKLKVLQKSFISIFEVRSTEKNSTICLVKNNNFLGKYSQNIIVFNEKNAFFSCFRYIFLLSTDEYLPHTVLERKAIDPQATRPS